jgi:hypothetical protein
LHVHSVVSVCLRVQIAPIRGSHILLPFPNPRNRSVTSHTNNTICNLETDNVTEFHHHTKCSILSFRMQWHVYWDIGADVLEVTTAFIFTNW